MLFERMAVATKPTERINQELSDLRDNDRLTPDLVFKSPYFLEFTGLKGMYSEKELEDCLLANFEQFMMEMGIGFSFVERQKRMIIDGEDFYSVPKAVKNKLSCFNLTRQALKLIFGKV